MLKDVGKLALDSVLKEGLLKDIPLIGAILNISKAGIAISNLIFAKKLIQFLQAVNNHSDERFREAFVKKVLSDNSKHSQVAEHLIEIINRTAYDHQLKIVANLLDAYVSDKLEWDEFQTLTFMLSQAPISAMKVLDEFSKFTPPFATHERPKWEGLLIGFGFADRHGTLLKVNEYGRNLHEFGIKPEIIK